MAIVTNRLGMPTGEVHPRDTSQPQWKITGAVAHGFDAHQDRAEPAAPAGLTPCGGRKPCPLLNNPLPVARLLAGGRSRRQQALVNALSACAAQ